MDLAPGSLVRSQRMWRARVSIFVPKEPETSMFLICESVVVLMVEYIEEGVLGSEAVEEEQEVPEDWKLPSSSCMVSSCGLYLSCH